MTKTVRIPRELERQLTFEEADIEEKKDRLWYVIDNFGRISKDRRDYFLSRAFKQFEDAYLNSYLDEEGK